MKQLDIVRNPFWMSLLLLFLGSCVLQLRELRNLVSDWKLRYCRRLNLGSRETTMPRLVVACPRS